MGISADIKICYFCFVQTMEKLAFRPNNPNSASKLDMEFIYVKSTAFPLTFFCLNIFLWRLSCKWNVQTTNTPRRDQIKHQCLISPQIRLTFCFHIFHFPKWNVQSTVSLLYFSPVWVYTQSFFFLLPTSFCCRVQVTYLSLKITVIFKFAKNLWVSPVSQVFLIDWKSLQLMTTASYLAFRILFLLPPFWRMSTKHAEQCIIVSSWFIM